jgi:predicted RNase H-like HicB family nuclease
MTPQSAADAAPISLTLTAVFEPAEEGWILATLPALPGVVTQGRSLEEARAMLADALREYLLALDDARAPSGDDATEGGLVLTIDYVPSSPV